MASALPHTPLAMEHENWNSRRVDLGKIFISPLRILGEIHAFAATDVPLWILKSVEIDLNFYGIS